MAERWQTVVNAISISTHQNPSLEIESSTITPMITLSLDHQFNRLRQRLARRPHHHSSFDRFGHWWSRFRRRRLRRRSRRLLIWIRLGCCRSKVLDLDHQASIDEGDRGLEVVKCWDQRSRNRLCTKSEQERLKSATTHRCTYLHRPVIAKVGDLRSVVVQRSQSLTESAKRQWDEYICTTSEGSHFRDFFNTERANRMWL